MIGTITLNPSVDQDLTIPKLVKDDAIRATGVEWFAGGKGCAFGFVGGLPGQMLTRWLATHS